MMSQKDGVGNEGNYEEGKRDDERGLMTKEWAAERKRAMMTGRREIKGERNIKKKGEDNGRDN